ncbi:immunoglobulin-like domain-containing protein, partial [Brevibacillus sp. SYSU BS000544]|uniref:immunoglobulin-like domain-containing protein n=1 Tax=Brevibacillus sp. SYSU BS000544 TaxID=3416443 RepID=UPI003CE454EE
VAGAKADLDDADLLNGNSALNNVTGNVTLPTTGINGTTVGWGSDNAAVGTDGTVTRPANGSGDATVTLTATISKNGTQDTKTFTVTVKEQEMTDAQAVAGAKADLDDADLLNGNSALNNVTGNLTLPITGINGTTVGWGSDNAAVGTDGSVIRPANGSGDATVTLTATISKNGTQDTKTFTVTVKEQEMTDAQAVAGAKADLDDADLLNGNSALNNVTGNVTLPTTGINGTTVGWGSDNAAVGTDGTVTRPANGSGDATVTLTATISKNGTQDTKTFTVTVKEQEMTDAQAVAGAKADLDDADLLNGNSALNNVTGNVTLPTTGINGTTVGWGSDNAAVGTDGTVTRPANGSGDATVTLTATISKNGTQDTKTFTVTVKEQEMTDAQAVAGAKADLDDADLLNGNSALNNITGNLTLPTTGINGTTVGWGSDNAAVGTDGTVTRPANGSGDATVTLTATISKNGTQDTKTFTVTVKEQEMTDAQAVAGAKADLDDADLLNGNSALNNVTGNLTLPITGINGTTVGWGSDNAAVGTDGTVTRPANGSGDATVTLTATISKNGTQDTKTFTVTVKEQEMTDAQAVAGAKADLDDADLLNGNSALNNVTGNVTLPTTGINGTTVGWGSDNAAVGTDGTVTRPANGSGDATVTLTATISKNGTQDTKTFTVTVKEQEMTDAQAVAGAKADLDDADLLNGNSALNNVTGNVTLPTTGINGTTVGWGSDNAAVGTDGTVTRPANGSGDATVTLTATISKNGTQDTKTFTVTVKEQEMTDAQAVAGAKADLDDADLLNGNSALNNVTGNLTLPTTGINGTTVGWGSDNAAVGTDGTVTRPAN